MWLSEEPVNIKTCDVTFESDGISMAHEGSDMTFLPYESWVINRTVDEVHSELFFEGSESSEPFDLSESVNFARSSLFGSGQGLP